jgi:CRP/FNR family transcriptional regulator, cyclic AMP receptor protein
MDKRPIASQPGALHSGSAVILVDEMEQAESDLFRESPILQGLAPEARRALTARLSRRRYRRNEVVFHQDDPGETLHLVRQGRLKILASAETGDDAVLTIVGPGEMFGELTLLDGGPRSATVIALEDVETATLSRADFLDLLRREPIVAEALLSALARTIRRLTEDVSALMFVRLRGRLARKLLELANTQGQLSDGAVEIQVPLTQEELASMIGGRRPRVNELLGFFEDEGAINRRGRHIVILDPDALKCWVSFPDE